MLRDALAGDGADGGEAGREWLADEIERQVPLSERFAERVAPALAEVRSFDVVGSGAQFGTAAQAALLLREVAGCPHRLTTLTSTCTDRWKLPNADSR